MKFPPTNRIDDLIAYMKSELQPLYDEREAANLSFLVAEEVLTFGKAQLMTRGEERIHQSELLRCMQMLEKLKEGIPFQYVCGYAYFCGLKFFTEPGALIPRPETEELVSLVLNECRKDHPKILDVGTGTGCIAIALKKKLPEAKMSASDISEKSLAIAHKNANALETEIHFMKADILKGEPEANEMWDVIVSNPPYIPDAEKNQMHINVTGYEPAEALFVPDYDPLLFYRALAGYAEKYLVQGGFLFAEIHESFGEATADAIRKHGFSDVQVLRDINGKDRMVKALKA